MLNALDICCRSQCSLNVEVVETFCWRMPWWVGKMQNLLPSMKVMAILKEISCLDALRNTGRPCQKNLMNMGRMEMHCRCQRDDSERKLTCKKAENEQASPWNSFSFSMHYIPCLRPAYIEEGALTLQRIPPKIALPTMGLNRRSSSPGEGGVENLVCKLWQRPEAARSSQKPGSQMRTDDVSTFVKPSILVSSLQQ